jgi:hypothetical protein
LLNFNDLLTLPGPPRNILYKLESGNKDIWLQDTGFFTVSLKL